MKSTSIARDPDRYGVGKDSILVSHMKDMIHRILIYDLSGKTTGEVPIRNDETVRLVAGSRDSDELLLETESFTEPIGSAEGRCRARPPSPPNRACIILYACLQAFRRTNL
jgi:hypothetical protein